MKLKEREGSGKLGLGEKAAGVLNVGDLEFSGLEEVKSLHKAFQDNVATSEVAPSVHSASHPIWFVTVM